MLKPPLSPNQLTLSVVEKICYFSIRYICACMAVVVSGLVRFIIKIVAVASAMFVFVRRCKTFTA